MPHRPLWNGLPLLKRQPARYMALVLLLPSLFAALPAAALGGFWAAAAAFLAAFVFMWWFQGEYFQ